jgi:large-conductance mechanosensitive channel
VSKVVSALVEDILNPIVGLLLGSAASLTRATVEIGPTRLMLGHFASVLIDFAMVAGA